MKEGGGGSDHGSNEHDNSFDKSTSIIVCFILYRKLSFASVLFYNILSNFKLCWILPFWNYRLI